MRAVLQRVSRAAVVVDGGPPRQIARGLVVLAGIHKSDTEQAVRAMARRIPALRIFDDADGRMNLDLASAGGGLLVVSNFTLHGSVSKGARPSWNDAAPPATALPLYRAFLEELRASAAPGTAFATGEFGAHMEIELVNDGPVTLVLDSPAAA
jgi:D-tyrosyl-tRNA(Tyr) deacylase